MITTRDKSTSPSLDAARTKARWTTLANSGYVTLLRIKIRISGLRRRLHALSRTCFESDTGQT